MNCLIYPFMDCHESLANTINSTREDINVTEKVVPNGCAPLLKERGFEFTTDFISALKKVEGVIITDCRNREWLKKDIISKIKIAIESGKTVYNCTEFSAKEIAEIELVKGYGNEKFVNYAVYSEMIDIGSHTYIDLECPVIATGNMLRGLDDSTELFEFTRKFRKKGFKTIPIGSTFESVLIGGYVFPENVYNKVMLEEEKIVAFNKYLNDIQLITGAEVIILNIPGGFMKYSDELYDSYGIRALMAASAVSVDYFIFNVPFDQIEVDSVNKLNTHLEQKYNICIDVFAVDSQYVHYGDSIEENMISYAPVNEKEVEKYVSVINEERPDIPFICLKKTDSYDEVVSRCIAKLS